MRIMFLMLLFCAFPVFGETERVLVLNNGKNIPFLKFETTDSGYLISTVDGKVIEVPFNDGFIKIVSDAPAKPVSLRVEPEKADEPKTQPQKPPVLKWNLPSPAPKILPVKKAPT